MTVKLLVFDWDGTLSDSLGRIVECLQYSASAVGLPVPSEDAGRDIIGLGLKEALARLFPGASGDQLDALKRQYSEHFVVLDREPAPFYHTVEETLETFLNAGYLLAVATGKSRKGLDRVLAGHGLGDYFHATRCADETRSKPHPQMLHELMDHFAVTPGEVWMVGDTEFDMEMALRAGVGRIGVSYGAHCASRLHPYGLHGCVDVFADIGGLLSSGQGEPLLPESGRKAD